MKVEQRDFPECINVDRYLEEGITEFKEILGEKADILSGKKVIGLTRGDYYMSSIIPNPRRERVEPNGRLYVVELEDDSKIAARFQSFKSYTGDRIWINDAIYTYNPTEGLFVELNGTQSEIRISGNYESYFSALGYSLGTKTMTTNFNMTGYTDLPDITRTKTRTQLIEEEFYELCQTGGEHAVLAQNYIEEQNAYKKIIENFPEFKEFSFDEIKALYSIRKRAKRIHGQEIRLSPGIEQIIADIKNKIKN